MNLLTQDWNWGLLHGRWILYQLSYQGSPVSVGLAKKFIRVFPNDVTKNMNKLLGQPNMLTIRKETQKRTYSMISSIQNSRQMQANLQCQSTSVVLWGVKEKRMGPVRGIMSENLVISPGSSPKESRISSSYLSIK